MGEEKILPMKPNERLAKTIALGRNRFVLFRGVLGWGLLTALLFFGWSCYSEESMSTLEVVIAFIVFPLGGIFWGAFMWSFLKKQRDATFTQSPQ